MITAHSEPSVLTLAREPIHDMPKQTEDALHHMRGSSESRERAEKGALEGQTGEGGQRASGLGRHRRGTEQLEMDNVGSLAHATLGAKGHIELLAGLG